MPHQMALTSEYWLDIQNADILDALITIYAVMALPLGSMFVL